MKKLCGRNEPCFVNGEASWGHMGWVLCEHASEYKKGEGAVAVCGEDKQEVQYYSNPRQYEMAKRCVKCSHNTAKWLMICIKCKWFYDNGATDESLEDLFKEE